MNGSDSSDVEYEELQHILEHDGEEIETCTDPTDTRNKNLACITVKTEEIKQRRLPLSKHFRVSLCRLNLPYFCFYKIEESEWNMIRSINKVSLISKFSSCILYNL